MANDPNENPDLEEDPDGDENTEVNSEADLAGDRVVDADEALVPQGEEAVGEPDQQDRDAEEVPVEVQRPSDHAIRGAAVAQPNRPWIVRFLPQTRRARQIQALQAGYTEMLDTMHSISMHLERQSEVQSGLLGALEHFPDAVDSLRNVGKATQQQTEVLELVKHRLESSASHEQQVVDSMNRFNNTLTMMDDTSRATSDTLGSLVDRSRESETTMRAMLERSERRTTLLLGFLGLLTIAAITAALYFGVTGERFNLGGWDTAATGLSDQHEESAAPESVKPSQDLPGLDEDADLATQNLDPAAAGSDDAAALPEIKLKPAE